MRNWIIVFFVIFAARLSAHDGDSIKITHGPYPVSYTHLTLPMN